MGTECIGIDFGTRNSLVSVWKNNKCEVIPDDYGNRSIPSVVSYYKTVRLVGSEAVALKEVNPKNTIFDVKRIIGRTMKDRNVNFLKRMLNYTLEADDTEAQNVMIKLDTNMTSGDEKIHPEEVASHIFQKLKIMAEKYLRKEVSKAVVTVPAYYNNSQREAIKDAVKIAGLDLVNLLNEPSAAALAYGMGNKKWNNSDFGRVLVYDWGAGTLDLSILKISKGQFTVLGVCGHNQLGGEDIDYAILNYVIKKFTESNKYYQKINPSVLSMIKLKNACENAKKILSKTDKTIISVENFYENKDLVYHLTSEEFNTLCHQIFLLAIEPIKDILKLTKLSKTDIDDVIIVGGSTKIPKIRTLILNFFENTNIKQLNCSMNPDEVVSAGAAIRAYLHFHNECPFGNNIILIDTVPLDLGVETSETMMTPIITRGTPIPIFKNMMFTTTKDNETSIEIKIFEGQRKLTKDNTLLGILTLQGFRKCLRGIPKILVTFQIDSNGIFQATAIEKNSDVSNSLQFNCSILKDRLTSEKIEELIKKAKNYQTSDTILAMKLGYIHELTEYCKTIGQNINNKEFHLTTQDRKEMKSVIKETLLWIQNISQEEVEVTELEKKVKSFRKQYAALITLPQKSEFKGITQTETGVEIHGDDKEKDYNDAHILISDKIPSEIKEIKTEIDELCHQLINLIKNPITTLDTNDVNRFNDYLESVLVWLYTSDSKIFADYVVKINEINKLSEDVIKNNSNIFDQNNNFKSYDELYTQCNVLYTSIKDDFLSIEEEDKEKLFKRIEDEMIWLNDHSNENDDIYRSRIESLERFCNEIYQKTRTIRSQKVAVLITETEEELDKALEELDADISIPIKENLDYLIDSMDKLAKDNDTIILEPTKTDDVLIKLDYNNFIKKPKSKKYKKGKATD